ncbi:TIGR03826 family flagellar region protein [Paenibacillus puerhi]|uniref:TIGR03826 family flagellar region protein n=1 Tax=Paenibacillus puerhi TaxID=2692622 RepID=UPI00135AAD11|nr:TIGR03826 family flagellar region protein [Paenibacillus puerhi]
MSLNVANCNRCGKVYMKNNYGLCPACIKGIEAEYEKCLNFLRDHRQCTIQELSDETGVEMKQIMKFIREGRISIKNNPNMAYSCEACAAPIREGNICEPCRTRLMKETSGLMEDEQKRREREANKGVTYKIKDRLEDR